MRKSKHGLTHFYFIKGVSILSQSSNARQSLAITILSLSLLFICCSALLPKQENRRSRQIHFNSASHFSKASTSSICCRSTAKPDCGTSGASSFSQRFSCK